MMETVETVPGLTRAEARRRLNEYGPNELPEARRTPAARILASQFKNVLILILLAAIVLSLALGHTIEAVAIAAIAIFSIVLGFVQEYRAERAIDALRRLSAPRATVVRDGEEEDVPGADVVPGDLLVLEAGDIVAADARLIETKDLHADEALLTGESVPVAKELDTTVFRSTAVTYGRGRAVVTATGVNTEVGKIGRMLSDVRSMRSPLERNLDRVGRWLARAAAAVVVLVVGVGILRGNPLLEMIVFGIALAVAVVPEALPAVVTISLAIGAQRMAKRRALIRRLPAVETLGSATVIASDKTGTLTTGEMTVREIFVGGRTITITGAGYAPQGEFSEMDDAVREILKAAALCTDAHLERAEDGRWRIRGDPTEGALVVAAAKAGLGKPELEAAEPRVGEIPFSSESKRMTTIHRGGAEYTKGAPEAVAPDSADRARDMASRALRVLAIAKNGEFLGLVGMIDAPRPEAREAVRTCHEAGIRPIMITGDHPETARAVAEELGLKGQVLTGLESTSDDELERRADEIDVYARVSPADKLRIVTALQKRGAVVAMTGDGVNDAPALRKADIGIAMGITGTDVAKEAAAMTLADDNFATIVAAVEEGRAIFDNIRKYLMYLLSSNFGEILLIAVAALLGLPLPLVAVQILYVNLASDGLPALALAVDPHGPGLMRRRPQAGIFTRPVVLLMLIGAAWSAVVTVSLFAWAISSGRPIEEARTMTLVALVLIEFFKAYVFRMDPQPFRNRWLNLAVLWELALLSAVIYAPFLQAPFGTTSLPAFDVLAAFAAAFTIVPVLEAAKARV